MEATRLASTVNVTRLASAKCEAGQPLRTDPTAVLSTASFRGQRLVARPASRSAAATGSGIRVVASHRAGEPASVASAVDSMKRAATESVKFVVVASASLAIAMSAGLEAASARPEGVNRPELLPEEFTTVIDVAGFLSSGQEARIAADVARLEQDTGYKLRVLAQNYPNTPGLAIRDYWGVDDETVVFVADPNMGNLLNFNVGATVDLSVPRSFWSRLAGKYGNVFFWREKGEDAAIEAAVVAIDACLREEAGPRQCSEVK
eukprot:TRINITY_DN9510_c0_g3_i1.p1 TRINITY_DN9510_c0_g3~~TRINITY_DN9510_c0_g3_i1.p1  ORF type:complete len:262 (-),score=-6.01 TRINITY_DN9510_c0_g3_i1:300-1085(-)